MNNKRTEDKEVNYSLNRVVFVISGTGLFALIGFLIVVLLQAPWIFFLGAVVLGLVLSTGFIIVVVKSSDKPSVVPDQDEVAEEKMEETYQVDLLNLKSVLEEITLELRKKPIDTSLIESGDGLVDQIRELKSFLDGSTHKGVFVGQLKQTSQHFLKLVQDYNRLGEEEQNSTTESLQKFISGSSETVTKIDKAVKKSLVSEFEVLVETLNFMQRIEFDTGGEK